MIRTLTLALLLLPLLFGKSFAQPSSVTVGSTTLDVRVVIEGNNQTNGIDIPWEIQWGPDNFIWMTERFGRVSRLDPVTGTRTTILDLTGPVYNSSESGLLGLQLHPDFANSPQVFLAYTYVISGGVIKERIVRYDYNSASGMLENPLTLIEGINASTRHIGCRLLILPDNTMLATTGDYQTPASAQDDNSLSGKVLRMNLDGTIPSDNPFGSSSYVYSKGHRNAQGLLIAPNGKIYSSEHGPSTNDEFNIIVPGGNYGWPDVEGFCTGSELTDCNAMTSYQDPLVNWYDNSTIAPSDIVYYDHPAIPEWQGKILMTVLKTEHVKVLELSSDGNSIVGQEIMFNSGHANNPTSTSSSTYNNGDFNRLRDVCVAPDGRVFLATSGSSWGISGTFTNTIVELKNSAYSPTGITDVQTLRTHVFPNPNSGTMSLAFDKKLIGSSFAILDEVGRTVYTGQLNSEQQKLDLPTLASGMYILQARNGKFVTNERILITE